MSSTPALFLDRDGVIIENRSAYVRSWNDVEIYPQALTALAQIRHTPYPIFIVTNQSAVGRGIISLDTAQAINDRLVKVIATAGGRIDAVFMCPHSPDARCNCRKPQPGLFWQAATQFKIDLTRSIMVGDALSDIQAGAAARLEHLILVRTGRGAAQIELPLPVTHAAFAVYDTLADVITAFRPSLLP